MFESLDITRMAHALAAHSGARLGVVAENIANADTPNYRARDLPDFAQVFDGAPDTATELRAPADPNGNTVQLEDQMFRMATVRQDHDMALAVYRSTASILRAALGKGGA